MLYISSSGETVLSDPVSPGNLSEPRNHDSVYLAEISLLLRELVWFFSLKTQWANWLKGREDVLLLKKPNINLVITRSSCDPEEEMS